MGEKWNFSGSAKQLSKFRADEVKAFLVKKGIKPDRVKTKGWGGMHEIFPDAKTLSQGMKNMRVEVHITER